MGSVQSREQPQGPPPQPPLPRQKDLPPSLFLEPQSDMRVSGHFPSLPSGQLIGPFRQGRPQASPEPEPRPGLVPPWLLAPWAPSCLTGSNAWCAQHLPGAGPAVGPVCSLFIVPAELSPRPWVLSCLERGAGVPGLPAALPGTLSCLPGWPRPECQDPVPRLLRCRCWPQGPKT